ncbi:hypothetical protein B0H63DRAFT_490140 [Podospora didyma]|uniref:Mtf2-like C-terminal domain-containing protein n=1 Tax=Podospora didyma TaxID=330526 RepID=A0AAE0N3G5_9PEZI|nr:hypothetical protein B0H63DRAFT_490140 [Podospora didyma]
MSTTVLPFLYHTRTLQRASRANISPPVFRALFHSGTRLHSPRKFGGRVVVPKHDLAARPSRDAIPFEGIGPSEHVTGVEKDDELEADMERSTITPTEQRTFDRIFDDIAKRNTTTAFRGKQQGGADSDPWSAYNATAPDRIQPSISVINKEAADTVFRKIVVEDKNAKNASSSRPPFAGLHPFSKATVSRPENPEKALMRFPPSLRRAARVALGMLQADTAAGSSSTNQGQQQSLVSAWHGEELGYEDEADSEMEAIDAQARSNQAEMLRLEERARVEALLKSAKTDFDLWDVLEKEVFSMVEKLGIADSTAPPRKKRRSRKKAVDGAPELDTTAVTPAEPERLPMHIYGPLYPLYLRLALRLLDQSFSRSSPLALNVLPRIKELGLASYVLGVNTDFYNNLAWIYWFRLGDAEAVFNLFEEMRQAGLYCDDGSLFIAQDIRVYFSEAAADKHGAFMKKLISQPEYEFTLRPRIKFWLQNIRVHIEERSRHLDVTVGRENL